MRADDARIMRAEGLICCELMFYIDVAFSNPLSFILSGPYNVNGVPLRRVNQRYVIATSTNVPTTGVDVSKIDDAFFAREKTAEKKGEEALFDAKAAKVTVTSPARKAAQEAVDSKLKANIDKVNMLGAYLAARFTLSKADKPHLIKF